MGSKKKAALHGLSKKERKALEAREAEIRAELERRAAKKAKKKRKAEAAAAEKPKKGKKSKAAKSASADLPELPPVVADAVADAKAARKAKRAEREAAATSTLDPAQTAMVEALGESVKKAKKSKRDETIDPETGKTRPEVIAERKAEREKTADEIDAAIKARLAKKRADRDPDDVTSARNADALDGETEVEYQNRKLRERAEADAVAKAADAVEAIKHAVEAVETEHGREFVVGGADDAEPAASDVSDFAQPSEAPRTDFEVNGNGQYKVARPSDGKLVGYTRVTTYIGCLEDTTMLTAWKMRLLLEGVAAAEELGDPAFTSRVRDLVHNRDLAIAKARKADRKGKLGAGELATYVDGAWSDFKRAMDTLADEAFELGGGREKAQKGTDIHDLCALAVQEGIDAVGAKLEAGEITPADLADVEAFLDALRRLGAKVIDVERVIVNDELKVAGRLDYILMLKLPGAQRASRYVADLKTGRVDYGTGKIAMQLGQYSDGVGYDLNTHEREDLKINRTKAILIHLPAGTAKATVHIADLGAARRGNKLAAEVRAWRNEGKKAIDLKSNVLDEIDAEASAA